MHNRLPSTLTALAAAVALAAIVALGGCATANVAEPAPRPAAVSDATAAAVVQAAQASLAAGEASKALALAEMLLDRQNGTNPQRQHALDVAGRAALAAGEVDTAVRWLSARHAAAPDVSTESLLGLALWRAGRANEARPFLLSALAADPGAWRAATALSELAVKDVDPARALALVSLAERGAANAQVPPPAARFALTRGRAHLLGGRAEEALAQFALAADHSQGRLDGGLDRRVALARTGRLDAALDGATATQGARVYMDLAEHAVARGERTQAVGHLVSAERLFPRRNARVGELMKAALALPRPDASAATPPGGAP